MSKINIMSLFANIGVAEAYMERIGARITVANELIKRRADLYKKIYPHTQMVCGDIFDEDIQSKLIKLAQDTNVELIMATPPCQGMSTAGRQETDDYRNTLFLPVVKLVKVVKPRYVFIENVPLFLQTAIMYNGARKNIIDIIAEELGNDYIINFNIANTAQYGVPQTRERAIILMTRNDQSIEWVMPQPDEKQVTMRDAIGYLPSIDPFIRDVSRNELLEMFPEYYEKEKAALNISPWNFPPHHIKRQVEVMMHTPTGQTAFSNHDKYKPKKENGNTVKGYFNTYKRQEWDIPAYTVTMDNRKISSQNNVHPGRYIGTDGNGDAIYSDARVLTVYELMKIMSLPDDWPIPISTPAAFLRSIIGEGIPPLFVKKIYQNLLRSL
ncbi:MAG: DNA cytosine methyltransferase [Clostridiales bacterium]|nr:DNA cytosine methyltransferase [Clostridiales bacterium]